MALTTVPASLSATALTLTTAAQPNITSVGTLTGLTVSGNIAGTLTTAAQTNITSVGTLSSLNVTGNVAISNSSGDTLTLTKSTTEPSLRIEGDTNKDFVITVSGELLTFTQNDGATDILTLDHDTKAAVFGGTISSGALTADSIAVDNITIDGQEIDISSGNFTLDVAGNIVLDSDTGVLQVRDGGTVFYQLAKSSNEIRITSHIADDDLVFRGNDSDGGGYFTALTLDMSEAGAATFNSTVATGGNLTVNGNTNLTGNLTVDSTTLYVDSSSNTVGIGTTSPSFTAVSGSTSQRGLHIQNSGNDTSAHLKLTAHNNTGTPGQATDFEIIHRGDALRTIFRHGGADVLTIDSAGKVGIGDSTPQALLDVGGGYGGNTSVATFAHATDAYIEIENMTTQNGAGIILTNAGTKKWTIQKDTSSHFLYIQDASNNALMTFTQSGTIGIGNSIPSSFNNSANNLVIGSGASGDNTGLTIYSNSDSSGSIHFADSTSGSNSYVGDIYYNHASNFMAFLTNATEAMRINSDGRLDIKNGGTDKIVRFINTGSGTQGITIGTTTGNSAGTGVHIGHQGTKAFIHPYNYAGGTYQQMEIACSDFVLKVNGSASGMSMDSSANAVFYGDVTINDANDRLKQNGVAREAKGGYIQGNQTVSYTINHTAQSTFHVRCGFNHYGLLSYGCVLDQIFANGPGGITSATATISSSTGPGGGWSVARVDNTNVTVSKSAGNYAGGGYYYIIVEGANL